MGCSDSKSVKTENGRPNNKRSKRRRIDPDAQFTSPEDAVEYLQSELGIPEDKARKIIDRIISYSEASQLSEEDLAGLTKKVKEMRSEMHVKFKEYDTDGNGVVSISEAIHVIKQQMPECAESTLKAIVNRYDQNQDGNIDYNEFTDFYCAVKCKSEELRNKFMELDRDQSGYIEPSEIVEVLKKELVLDGPDQREMAESVIEDFDTNQDGKLSKDEFVNLWVKMFGLA